MNLTIDTSIPLLTVFVQGLLSFFSPCIFPLIPLYMGYLAGGTVIVDDNGEMHYPRKKIMINTVFFILGIGFAFVLLGLGFNALGQLLSGYKTWISRTSGIIMVFFGLYQIGFLGTSKMLESEKRLPVNLEKISESPFFALIMGFTFSFAWTPCVGPVLTSVLLMASSTATAAAGFGMIGVYMLGFVLPFLAVGVFTGAVL
jgi:cytochrome c-type biogenesis protein